MINNGSIPDRDIKTFWRLRIPKHQKLSLIVHVNQEVCLVPRHNCQDARANIMDAPVFMICFIHSTLVVGLGVLAKPLSTSVMTR